MNGKSGTAAVRMPALVALFTVAPLVEARRCLSLSSLLGGDVWWHLSSGLWILHNHALPHNGLFSQAPGNSWAAVSWLYDLKLAVFYQLFGLRAIPIFAMLCKMGLAVVTFLLAGGWRRNFWPAVGLSAVAQYILGSAAPTPVYGSILFFGLELLLLLETRRSLWSAGARVPHAAWTLPPVFLVWANMDVHFFDGLVLLVIFVTTIMLPFDFSFAPSGPESSGSETHGIHRGLHSAAASRLSLSNLTSATASRFLLLIAAACFVGTAITPNVVQPYRVFFASVFGAGSAYVPDYKAPGFRQPQDYVLVLLTMAAFLALGLRRSRDLFLVAILVIASALSFYSQRDVWLTVIVAAAVIGEMLDEDPLAASENARPGSSPAKSLGLAFVVAVVVVVVGAAALTPRSQSALLAKAAQSYPVGASDYIRAHGLPRPIFNAFEWGGFLTYYLPECPVAIDGRTDLYGDDFIVQYSKAMSAEIRYTDFAPMANAQAFLLPRAAIMAGALGTLPGYRVAYQDDVSTVITKENR